jgi:hypothetical protein
MPKYSTTSPRARRDQAQRNTLRTYKLQTNNFQKFQGHLLQHPPNTIPGNKIPAPKGLTGQMPNNSSPNTSSLSLASKSNRGMKATRGKLLLLDLRSIPVLEMIRQTRRLPRSTLIGLRTSRPSLTGTSGKERSWTRSDKSSLSSQKEQDMLWLGRRIDHLFY